VAELAGAGLLGVLAVRVHPALVLSAACTPAAGIVLAVVDDRIHRLSDPVVVPTRAALAVRLATAGVAVHRPTRLGTAVVGGTATFAVYVLLGLVTGGRCFGDPLTELRRETTFVGMPDFDPPGRRATIKSTGRS
jgi:hypothetical protein